MHWTTEPTASFPQQPRNMLTAGADEPQHGIFVEFWRRVLSDVSPLPLGQRWSVLLEVFAKTFEADNFGFVEARIRNSLNKPSDGIGTYTFRSERFTCLQREDEDDVSFQRRHLEWSLVYYKALKAALRDDAVWLLFGVLNSPQHTLRIDAATSNGWFDLQPDQDAFGALPANDERLIAGVKPVRDNPLAGLMRGVLNLEQPSLVDELVAALVQYTPQHFKTIECTIAEGVEGGQRALFYNIQCPDFPDEGTTDPNQRLHQAATNFVQYLSKTRGGQPRVRLTVEIAPDNTYTHRLEL